MVHGRPAQDQYMSLRKDDHRTTTAVTTGEHTSAMEAVGQSSVSPPRTALQIISGREDQRGLPNRGIADGRRVDI